MRARRSTRANRSLIVLVVAAAVAAVGTVTGLAWYAIGTESALWLGAGLAVIFAALLSGIVSTWNAPRRRYRR